MSNIPETEEIGKDDRSRLHWEARTRAARLSAIITSIRKTIDCNDAALTQVELCEALTKMGEGIAYEAINLIDRLGDAAELWEARSKEAGWKNEAKEGSK